jgi:hypothetical protein
VPINQLQNPRRGGEFGHELARATTHGREPELGAVSVVDVNESDWHSVDVGFLHFRLHSSPVSGDTELWLAQKLIGKDRRGWRYNASAPTLRRLDSVDYAIRIVVKTLLIRPTAILARISTCAFGRMADHALFSYSDGHAAISSIGTLVSLLNFNARWSEHLRDLLRMFDMCGGLMPASFASSA